jgi:hypothetical protein
MLTCFITISFHHKALHVVIELFPCLVRHVLMLVVSILHLHYPAAAQMDVLRIFLETSMGSRHSFPVSCLWRTSACVSFSAVSYLNDC